MTRRALPILFSVQLALAATATQAQSVTVIGGGQAARNCYMAATIAAQMHTASSADVRECTFALEHTSLRLHDIVATLINRGVIYVAMEEYDLAIRDYDRAYSISPDVAEIHVNRGNLLFMSRIFDQAITEYTRAIELDLPKLYIAFYNRGLTYEKMGELEKAADDYRHALELMPDWSRAREKLELLQHQTRNS